MSALEEMQNPQQGQAEEGKVAQGGKAQVIDGNAIAKWVYILSLA